LDTDDGKTYIYDEYWTDKEAYLYKREEKDSGSYEDMVEDISIANIDTSTNVVASKSNIRTHDMGDVPFVQFANNHLETGDLDQYKGQIDAYDIVMNGFVNDVVDVQQVILVLSGYGDQKLDEFMNELKNYKSIKMDSDEDVKSGVDTLTIDIPVDARNSLLEKLNDDIYTFGQGLDPNKVQMGTAVSGVALKMMHSALEMKAAKTESEFTAGLNRLIRFILRYLGHSDDIAIKQKWVRALIQNDSERADIVSKLSTVTSKETLAKSNPLVEDWAEELAKLNQEDDGSDEFDPDTDKDSDKNDDSDDDKDKDK
jgi:SPP1 family phage portal protein